MMPSQGISRDLHAISLHLQTTAQPTVVQDYILCSKLYSLVKHCTQVVPALARVGRRHDILLLNFGLHFSKTYKKELEALVAKVQ